MTPEQIKSLRRELDCTARELAGALGIERETVFAWERGERFPTKQFVEKMQALRKLGRAAIVRRRPAPSSNASSFEPTPSPSESHPPWRALADPVLWQLLRKLIAHPALRRAVAELAESYEDPATDPGVPPDRERPR